MADFDVVAVDIKSGATRIIAERQSRQNADAIVKLAVMRRGVGIEFFKTVPAGTHRSGVSAETAKA